MTYCMGFKLQQNIVLISDSRTSAGIDDVSVYSKMWRYGIPGQRQFALCSAGNLATTQAVIARLERDIADQEKQNLCNVKDMQAAAEYLGKVSVESQKQNTGGGPVFESTFLFAGEILGSPANLFHVYSAGNFIACSAQVPFLQIGETKYGKPILDRLLRRELPVDRAILCGLVSMDATIKSNLSVGPPIEIYVLDEGSLLEGRHVLLEEKSEYIDSLRNKWNSLMSEALDKLPKFELLP